MELFELRRLIFLVRSRWLINVNKICGLLRNGWRTIKWWVIYGRPPSLIVSFMFFIYRKVKLKIYTHPLKEDRSISIEGGRSLLNSRKSWLIYTGVTMSIIGKKIHEIGVFLYIVTWILQSKFLLGVSQIIFIYTENSKNLQSISFCLIWSKEYNTISNLQGQYYN